MKKLTALLLSLILLLSLTACGASTKYAADSAVRQEVMEEAPAMMAMGTAQNSTSENGSAGNSLPDNRKWIITVDMNVETDDLETMLSALNDRIAALDGYIEDQSIYNGSTYANRRYRNANLTIRIPADRVSEFSEEIGSLGNVVSNNLRREDVTLQYVDTEGRVKALQTEEARLLDFMEQAETPNHTREVIDRLGAFVDIARGSGVSLCHENEKGIYGATAEGCLTIHKALPSIKGIFDPANFVQCGVDTVEAWEKLHAYTYYLHIKDALPDGNVVPSGKGVGNVAHIVRSYLAAGGKHMTVEPHLTVFDGLAALEEKGDTSKIGAYTYPSKDRAFDMACNAIKDILGNI